MVATVSIVVAVKNGLPLLRRLVYAARYTGLIQSKLVIVDGGSTDGTVEWLADVAPAGSVNDLCWVSQQDSGIAEAWNRGVSLADGEWVVFLGADDIPGDAGAWADAVAVLGELPPSCEIAAFPVSMTSPTGTLIQVVNPSLGPCNRSIFALNTLPHQGVFHRRDLWRRLGGFDASYPVACDYEFLVRAIVAGCEVRLCAGPPPVRMTFGGASKRAPLENLWEFRRVQIAHGVRGLRLTWWLAWVRAVLRAGARPLIGEAGTSRIADAIRRLRGLPRAWTVR
jgi:GT2 family glycosyltransferase